MNLPQPFLIALQFLTVLPIKLTSLPDNKSNGASLLYYPVVGLLLGTLVTLVAVVLESTPAPLAAILVLGFWVFSTSALHLDGLADSADALVGGFGNREKTLNIMKDPCCGPAAAVTLIIILAIKYTAIEQIIGAGNWAFLVVTPFLSRSLLIILFLTTAYVRENGLGHQLAGYLPRDTSKLAVAAVLIVTFVIIGFNTFWLLITVAGIFMGLRQLMLRRIGGTTGDTAGALVEVCEAGLLVTAVLVSV